MIPSKHLQIIANSSWRLLILHKLYINWGQNEVQRCGMTDPGPYIIDFQFPGQALCFLTYTYTSGPKTRTSCVSAVISWSSLNSLCFCCCCCLFVLFPRGPQGPGFSTVVVKTAPQLHFNIIKSSLEFFPHSFLRAVNCFIYSSTLKILNCERV